VTLVEALELTALVAVKDWRRLDAFATRWLQRYLEETDATLADAAVAIGCLSALGGPRHDEALAALRAMADSRERFREPAARAAMNSPSTAASARYTELIRPRVA
jgi:hypothetical protein